MIPVLPKQQKSRSKVTEHEKALFLQQKKL